MRIGIITPFKNEKITIERFIYSVLKQKDCVYKWLLIDDGSEDGGDKIAKELTKKKDCITVINRTKTPGQRKTGSNVVDIIYEGIEIFKNSGFEYDIVLKLDADLEIDDENYFSGIVSKFKQDPNLYIASGAIYNLEGDEKKLETIYFWHTQGQTKFYRREFLEEIGIKRMTGWDGVDDILAIENGKKTKVFREFMVRHYYKTRTRSVEAGIWGGYQREALGYVNRYYPFFMFILKALKFSLRKPIVFGGLYFLTYSLYFKFNHESVLTKEEIHMVKRFSYKRLFGQI